MTALRLIKNGHVPATRGSVRSDLEFALIGSGIKPLEPKAVEAYKAQMLAAHPASFVWRFCTVVGYDRVLSAIALATILILACCIIGAAVVVGWFGLGRFLLDTLAGHGAPITIAESTVSVMLLCLCWLVGIGTWRAFRFLNSAEMRGPARWVTYSHSEFRDTIPVFARMQMFLLKEQEPSVRFLIENLEQEHRSLDPILYALLPSPHAQGGIECHAIAVWDERGERVDLKTREL